MGRREGLNGCFTTNLMKPICVRACVRACVHAKIDGEGLRLPWAEEKLSGWQAYGTDLGRRDDRSGSVALWRNGQAELLRRTCLIQTQGNTQDCGETIAQTRRKKDCVNMSHLVTRHTILNG